MQFLWNIHHIQNHVNQFFSWILITSRYLPIFSILPKTSNFHLEEIYIYIYIVTNYISHCIRTKTQQFSTIREKSKLSKDWTRKSWIKTDCLFFRLDPREEKKSFIVAKDFKQWPIQYIYTHIVNCASAVLFFFLPLCFLSSPHLTMPSNESPPFNIRNNGFLVSPEENEFFTLSSR